MKRLTCALLSVLLITPCMANVHIDADTVVATIGEYFPDKQTECMREYNAQVKASDGAGISAQKIWNVCATGGLDIQKPADKKRCLEFVNKLVTQGTIKFYETCGKDSGVEGAVCVKDFKALTVNMQQAQGLSKLYARNKKLDADVQCRTRVRVETQTTHTINTHAMGMSSTTNIPYVQCTSKNKNLFYEFQFNNVDGNIDATNHRNFKLGICKVFGSEYTQKDMYGYKWDICSDVKDEETCGKIDEVVRAGNVGYVASWGPAGYKLSDRGYQITSTYLPYCVLSEDVIKDADGRLVIERTAYGLDGRVFLNAGIQRKGSKEIKQQIQTYVENQIGKENVKTFSCEDTYHTVKLAGRSGKDDMLRCTVNGKIVEFFFDDLSEAWHTYNKSGREAMNCITWGGTFTGQKCVGLNEQMCNMVRNATAESCPECKEIKWDSLRGLCELPSSVDATNLRRGLNYSAIVGGAVVGVVVTVGTLGAASAGTVIVLAGLGIETLGSAIELKAQRDIYKTADEFFENSAYCNDKYCAEYLIMDYLKTMANQQNDLSEAELNAVDSELARLAELVPDDSELYNIFINGFDLESNETGEWTDAQIWRAVGIGMQSVSVLTGIGRWVVSKSPLLQKGLQKTSLVFSKRLRKAAQVARANFVDYDKLDDVGKEWYALWKRYAPNNQTFDEFKAMTNGDLNEMKRMAQGWGDAAKGTVYSTYDPEFARLAKAQGNSRSWFNAEVEIRLQRFMDNGGTVDDFFQSAEYDELLAEYMQKIKSFKNIQWRIADEFQLKNLDNVVAERVKIFDDVMASNPDLQAKLERGVWRRLSNEERTDVAQRIVDEYAARIGAPSTKVIITKASVWKGGEANFDGIVLNQLYVNESLIKSILTHEYGHVVDLVAPNLGALGEQYAQLGRKVYNSSMIDGYRVALTEQSSFAIGNATDAGGFLADDVAAVVLSGGGEMLIWFGAAVTDD
ncbi:MAG: hypothetical protein J6W40_03970 [Alphaproteobacteria bacterium]|nr:hypothetical protein [Alphaproteobacteria bacterium]